MWYVEPLGSDGNKTNSDCDCDSDSDSDTPAVVAASADVVVVPAVTTITISHAAAATAVAVASAASRVVVPDSLVPYLVSFLLSFFPNSLVGLVVKASALRAEDPGFESR